MSLPESVTNLLKSTRFVHLATSLNDVPHVSLMNYTYYKGPDHHCIIISTPTATTKYENMVSNPRVSVLVHDWISVKTEDKEVETPATGRRNSLYEMLANINKNELGRFSVMLVGEAEIVHQDSEKFPFYRSLHLNNSKIEQSQAKNYIEPDGNAIVVINIKSCKVTDTDNNIAEY